MKRANHKAPKPPLYSFDTGGIMLKQVTHGFTLVEMIGVLAIIAIVVALVSPRIMDQVQKSGAANLAPIAKPRL